MTVQILLGSISDREVAASAEKVLKELDVPFQITVASAHRSPARVEELVRSSKADVFIAIAGLTNALAGVVGALTTKPVIGVPVSGKLNLDSILSVVQLPPGMPVAAVGLDRGDNAAHLAAQMIALRDPKLAERLKAYKKKLADKVVDDAKKLETTPA
ncbi:MAG: 5-(carboxyamino)imidazole ribonucleotide mutase [Euryarchaeota archaeon]|nr:5-(carboxyamino)imidazole ribonucleotide mutase [Euryarchaeota archaeon]